MSVPGKIKWIMLTAAGENCTIHVVYFKSDSKLFIEILMTHN